MFANVHKVNAVDILPGELETDRGAVSHVIPTRVIFQRAMLAWAVH